MRAGPAWRKPFLDILLSLKLFQIVKKYGIEIIHAHNYEATLSGIVARVFTGVPVLFHTHGVMDDELHTYYQNRFARYIARKGAWLLDTVVARWADHIIAISPEIKPFMETRVHDHSKVDYIPPGIFYPEFVPKGRESVRNVHNIGQGPMILYTGNLDRYQNLDFLINSFSLVLKKIPEAKLVLLTHCETDYYEKLWCDSAVKKNVILVKNSGFDEVQHFLEESSLTVLPRTSWSGFPIKLLNYMAAGKAVVTCESSAKAIEHLRDGLKVKDNDMAGFAESIVVLLNDDELRKRLGDNARIKARNCFAWDQITVKVEKLYDRILAEKTGSDGCRLLSKKADSGSKTVRGL